MRDEIVSLTKKLIEIPSSTHDRAACLRVLEFVQKELEGFSFTAFSKDGIPSVLYTNTPKPTKACKLIFNAHLDVIQASPNQYKPFEKDGKLYGRGAYDMKAAAAVSILLFKKLADKLTFTLGLQLTTDEEIIGYKGVGHQVDKGVTAEFVISGECGSNFRIINQLRGLYVIKISASGESAHAAYPWLGDNALHRLYNAIHEIMQHFPIPKKATWKTTINLAKIETSNTIHNMSPRDAAAYLDVRFIPKDENTVLAKIESFLPKDIKVKMELVKSMPSHQTIESNPYILQLTHDYKKITNNSAEIASSYGGSDIIFFSQKNIDGIEFGPKGDGHHSNDEWVNIESLEQYYKILKQFLLSVK